MNTWKEGKGMNRETDCLNIIMTTKHHYCDQIMIKRESDFKSWFML